ncbi:MAG: ABC transporter substrate binding protein [Burkholderiales bacterium]
MPGRAQAAALWNPSTDRDPLIAAEAAARALGITLQTIEVRNAGDFDRAFAALAATDARALLVLSSPLFYLHRTRITGYATQRRLPAITQFRKFAEAGDLMSYGPNLHELFGSLSAMTARILNGAKPADLPIE